MRHYGQHVCNSTAIFQSTHPRGVRPAGMEQVPDDLIFQSTHPRGVRRRAAQKDVQEHEISIHAPTWGATFENNQKRHTEIFQSTHPRGVRQAFTRGSTRCCQISIHAPTWGATRLPELTYRHIIISIHAPTWGATWPRTSGTTTSFYFNPRTHVGCDVFGRFN